MKRTYHHGHTEHTAGKHQGRGHGVALDPHHFHACNYQDKQNNCGEELAQNVQHLPGERRASIVGGRLRAAEEINAKNLGSVAGAETVLEVGYDPRSKEKLIELQGQNDGFSKEMEEIERNVNTLENLKKVHLRWYQGRKRGRELYYFLTRAFASS